MRVPFASELLPGTPKAGTAAEVEDAARVAALMQRDAQSFGAAAVAAGDGLSGLESAAVTALRVRVTELVVAARAVEAGAATAKTAFGRHAQEVERIDRAADRLLRRVTESLEGIHRSAEQLSQICAAISASVPLVWNEPPNLALPVPRLDRNMAPSNAAEQAVVLGTLVEVHRAPWQHAVLGWQGHLADVWAGVRRWEELIAERVRAEQHLESQLRGGRFGQLVELAAGNQRGLTRMLTLGLFGGSDCGGDEIQGRRTQHRLLTALFPAGEASGSWEDPPEAQAVGVWWDTLTPSEREAVIRAVPAVVGNLPGLPALVRDRANRLVLEWCQGHPHLLSPEQLRVAAAAHHIVTTATAQHTPDPPVQVLALELSSEVPKAAIGYGALDTATHLTWQVPGMNSDSADALHDWDTAGRNLFQTERSLLWREGAGAPGVIAWLGYDTPGLPPSLGVLRSDAAVAGARRLAAELDGMASARLRAGRAAATTVVAHSYGTTVASLALTRAAAPVLSFVMLGSAGLDTTLLPTLEQVGAAPTAVFATNARRDLLAPTGAVLSRRGLPTNDARAVFGLHEQVPVYGGIVAFPSEGDPSRGLLGTNGHSVIGAGGARGLAGISASEGRGYGDLETQSLLTTARIATQTLDPRTVQGFSSTEAQRVREFVDTSGGRKTFVRVPALGKEQR